MFWFLLLCFMYILKHLINFIEQRFYLSDVNNNKKNTIKSFYLGTCFHYFVAITSYYSTREVYF